MFSVLALLVPVIFIRPATARDLDFIANGNVEMAPDTEGVMLDPAVLRAAGTAVIGEITALNGNLPIFTRETSRRAPNRWVRRSSSHRQSETEDGTL